MKCILSYRVTEQGDVWALYRHKSFLLKPSMTIYKYSQLGIKGRSVRAHRFIWEYFNGPIPNGLIINHLNGIKNDNRLSNLELITCKGNSLHASKLNLLPKGEKNSRCKLLDKDVKSIRMLHSTSQFSFRKLAKIFQVSPTQIKNIIHLLQRV